MFRSSSPSSRLPSRVTAVTLTAVLAGLGAAGTASSSPPAAAAAPTSGSPRTCALSDLYLSMGRKEGAAGSLYWTVRFTNTSTTSCSLRGYPGVSALDTAHRQIGPAAHHTGEHYSTVRLAPAHSASAVIRTTNGPLGGPCLPTGTYLRIYPPGSYHATLVPAHWTICSHLFDVSPIKA
ncbi:DUF4232 domain-containing protein [Streptomyces sp. NPDC050145]|uniref:DUF4232 domain-containing protein n=1 Tax=Streptomyces sp. NPDC050145 TaxID=3365602 RepID=UPI003790B330